MLRQGALSWDDIQDLVYGQMNVRGREHAACLLLSACGSMSRACC